MGEYSCKMMIVMRRDLKMRKGKIAAQAGHACVDVTLMALQRENRFEDLTLSTDGMTLRESKGAKTPLSAWFTGGVAKICVYVDSEEALLEIAARAEEKGILAAVVTDAGATEFHGVPTRTCLALEPLPAELANELTGHLPLY